jgi:chaperone required for assembly of F1-ATPase
VKRFWDNATFVPEDGGFAIRLDSRPLRLAGGITLRLQGEALASAIAAEWQEAGGRKGGDVQPDSLPLTGLAATAQERVAPNRETTVDGLVAYAATDLLCYRAAHPPELAARQASSWQWLLDRAHTIYGAMLVVTTGVMPISQSASALAALRNKVLTQSDAELAALAVVVPATSSLILGLSLTDGAISAAETHNLAFLDSDFQAEKWGEDREALARRGAIAVEIEAAARFMSLTRT